LLFRFFTQFDRDARIGKDTAKVGREEKNQPNVEDGDGRKPHGIGSGCGSGCGCGCGSGCGSGWGGWWKESGVGDCSVKTGLNAVHDG